MELDSQCEVHQVLFLNVLLLINPDFVLLGGLRSGCYTAICGIYEAVNVLTALLLSPLFLLYERCGMHCESSKCSSLNSPARAD